MIDLHCHIIPHIDDGARNAHIACAMARHAVECGVKTVVATPHCNLGGRRQNYRGRDYDLAFGLFRALLKQSGIPLELLPGAEVFVHPANIRSLIDRDMLVTLNHSRYLLVEFPFDCEGKLISKLLGIISQRGLVPVVAHPERYEAVQLSPRLAAFWFSQGYVIQLNCGSLLGCLGQRAQSCGVHLLRHGLAHVIASDAHDTRYRPTGFDALPHTLCSEDYWRLLLQENPARILSDRPIA